VTDTLDKVMLSGPVDQVEMMLRVPVTQGRTLVIKLDRGIITVIDERDPHVIDGAFKTQRRRRK
jgi:hypothetical protein